jgi:hypothetical protein
MNKPARVVTHDSKTTERSLRGNTGGFKSSVPANAVRPRPVIVPVSKGK